MTEESIDSIRRALSSKDASISGWREEQAALSRDSIAALLTAHDKLVSRMKDLEADAARYREILAAGLPVTFLGQKYEGKEKLDTAIDVAREKKAPQKGV